MATSATKTRKPKRRFVLSRLAADGRDEYYTVYGWAPGATTYVSSAVLFPNDMMALPEEGGWKRVTAYQGGCGLPTLKKPVYE